MTIIGFNFTKMVVERKVASTGKINVNNNVAITNVKKMPLQLGSTKQDALQMDFEFQAKYEPKVGSIDLHGHIVYMDAKDKLDELEKKWKKDKKLPRELMAVVLNHILGKCNVEAIILSREINLPPSIPMPRITEKKEE